VPVALLVAGAAKHVQRLIMSVPLTGEAVYKSGEPNNVLCHPSGAERFCQTE